MPETTVVTEHKSMSIPVSVKELLEALIFAASEPLTVKQLKNILQEAEHAGELSVEAVIETLNEEYQQTSKPFRIIRIAGGYQFATMPEYAEWVGKLYKEQGRRKLSQSSLETLAIIAYRQPITRPDIEAIRGVDCDYVLGTLLEKKLVTISGRAPTPGRPLLYGTTDMFLKHFGLNDITDLPKPREIEELLADSRYETERRMLEAQEQAEKEKKEEEDFKSRLPHIPKKKPDMDDPVEILHKKSGMDLTIKKEDADVVIQDAIEQTGLDTLEPAGSVSLKTNDLEETIESSSELQIENNSTVDSPTGFSPVEMPVTLEKADTIEDQTLDEQLEPQNSTQSDAPDATTSEVISNEAEPSSVDTEMQSETSDLVPEVPEVEPPNTDIVVRLTEDLISEQEEDEAFEVANAQTPLLHEIADPPAVEIEPVETEIQDTTPESTPVTIPETVQEITQERSEIVERTSTDEAPTESAQTVEEPPSNSTTAEAPRRADAPAVPPFVAPIVDEVRVTTKPKSRWQQFKETVQGLLKKVFG